MKYASGIHSAFNSSGIQVKGNASASFRDKATNSQLSSVVRTLLDSAGLLTSI